MRKEDLLRRLEERLARGEISERTYLDIKARYDAMPERPEPSESPEEPMLNVADASLRDLEGFIQKTVERAMGQVAQGLQSVYGSEEFEKRMEDVGRRVEAALGHMTPTVETGDRTVVIRGSGVVSGDTSLEEFRCAGSGRVEGDLRAEEVRIDGACKIEGSCDCEEFSSSGTTRVGADLRAEEVDNSGALQVGGSLKAAEVTAEGSLEVAGWLRADEFISRGRFNIGGGLEAKEVDISLSGNSRVPVIKANEVRVRRGKKNGELEADTIEANEVYLESTKALHVKGTEVRIGPFCTIGSVEARELEVHESSTVGEKRVGDGVDGPG